MKESNRTLIGAAVLVISAVMIYLGTQNGEAAVVLKKAVNICLECIGIG